MASMATGTCGKILQQLELTEENDGSTFVPPKYPARHRSAPKEIASQVKTTTQPFFQRLTLPMENFDRDEPMKYVHANRPYPRETSNLNMYRNPSDWTCCLQQGGSKKTFSKKDLPIYHLALETRTQSECDALLATMSSAGKATIARSQHLTKCTDKFQTQFEFSFNTTIKLPNGNVVNENRVLRVEGYLGSGGFCHVFRARQVLTDGTLGEYIRAVKFMRIPGDTEIQKYKDRHSKRNSWPDEARHDHCINILGWSTNEQGKDKNGNVFDYMPEGLRPMGKWGIIVMDLGHLGELCENFVGNGFNERFCKIWVRDMLKGVAFMHEHGVQHRDIKPENMVIDVFGRLKQCDFGLMSSGYSMSTRRERLKKHSLQSRSSSNNNGDDTEENKEDEDVGLFSWFIGILTGNGDGEDQVRSNIDPQTALVGVLGRKGTLRSPEWDDITGKNPNQFTDIWSCGLSILMMYCCENNEIIFTKLNRTNNEKSCTFNLKILRDPNYFYKWIKDNGSHPAGPSNDFLDFLSKMFTVEFPSIRNNTTQIDGKNVHTPPVGPLRWSAEKLLNHPWLEPNSIPSLKEWAIELVERNPTHVYKSFKCIPSSLVLSSSEFYPCLVGAYYKQAETAAVSVEVEAAITCLNNYNEKACRKLLRKKYNMNRRQSYETVKKANAKIELNSAYWFLKTIGFSKLATCTNDGQTIQKVFNINIDQFDKYINLQEYSINEQVYLAKVFQECGMKFEWMKEVMKRTSNGETKE